MATEDEGGMEDVESSLEPEGEGGGLRETLGNLKDRYVDFHTVDEESENWSDEPALGSISRRGFLAGTAEVAAVGYGISEATDGDGWNVDWSIGNSQGAGGGVGPIGGGGNGNETDAPGGQQAMDGNNQLGTAGDVSDELYLQEDGTVVAIDTKSGESSVRIISRKTRLTQVFTASWRVKDQHPILRLLSLVLVSKYLRRSSLITIQPLTTTWLTKLSGT